MLAPELAERVDSGEQKAMKPATSTSKQANNGQTVYSAAFAEIAGEK